MNTSETIEDPKAIARPDPSAPPTWRAMAHEAARALKTAGYARRASDIELPVAALTTALDLRDAIDRVRYDAAVIRQRWRDTSEAPSDASQAKYRALSELQIVLIRAESAALGEAWRR